ncbi:PspC domain-containing protein [Streptosporangium vulgare]|uniref:PspC domain-containing protein n=1 Tax=Streptosporangium vulgare TaxID=46190 RepID=UPI0031D094AB
MTEDAPFPRLVRAVEGRLVAGVARGPPPSSGSTRSCWRLAFVLLTVLNGFGALAYAALWMFTPREPYTRAGAWERLEPARRVRR